MKVRLPLIVAVLSAWIAGATLGSISGPVAADAAASVQVGKVRANYVPDLEGDDPIFILAIGSDARVDDGTPVERGLGDSIHIIGINPQDNTASILGFPRDSWVDIPCFGQGKINNALASGGPECMVETVEQLTKIKIDYWMLTSFDGVKDGVDEIGRLTLDVPFTMHDSYAKSDFTPGTYDLRGYDVLAFGRDRHSFSQGDFARSENQARIMIAALAQYQDEFSSDPSRMLDWISVGMRAVETDLSLDELVRFGFAATAFNPKKVQNIVVPGSIGMEGEQSVVSITSAAQPIYKDLAKHGYVEKKHLPPSPTAGE
ncbi:MAG: LCP family protein [Actinomycetota bacterium]